MHTRAILASLVFTFASVANAEDKCDDVLVLQTEAVSQESQQFNSWLQLIDESKFDQIKKSGRVVSDYFRGNFSNFREKRSMRFQQTQYYSSTAAAREEFKSFYKDAQISAWIECMKIGKPEIIVRYDDVDAEGATIRVTWKPSTPGLSEIRLTPGQLTGAKENPKWMGLSTLSGDTNVRVLRESSTGSISGTLNGLAGTNGSYSANIYVRAFVPPSQPSNPPRYLLSARSLLLKSTARWNSAEDFKDYDCKPAYAGFDLIVLAEKTISIGKNLGFCAPRNRSHCNSAGEICTETFVAKGCWINTEWHNWYKAYLAQNKLPYSRESVCAPIESTSTASTE